MDTKECPKCNGTGRVWVGRGYDKCPVCNGRQYILILDKAMQPTNEDEVYDLESKLADIKYDVKHYGYADFLNGVKVDQCPFKIPALRNEWQLGWLQAKEDSDQK